MAKGVISRICEIKKMLGLWSIESTPENAAMKSLCARRVHGKGRRYKQVRMKEQRVGTSYQSSALEVDSWWLGLGRKTAEQSQLGAQMRTCLIQRSIQILDPQIWRRVSIWSSSQAHGRDKLAFSVRGWRQVSAPRNECTVTA